MRVDRIMSRRVVSVEPDDTLAEVKRILEQAPFHHLVVMDRNRLVGVISDRDLMAAISPYAGKPAETARDAATLNKRAHQIMSRQPRTVTPETGLDDAVAALLSGPGGCLPVIDGDGRAARRRRDLARPAGRHGQPPGMNRPGEAARTRALTTCHEP